MTRVLIPFGLTGALDEALLDRIARAHGIYGILHVQVRPGLDGLDVEYDASRLSVNDVEAALLRAAIPVRRREA